jgi:N-acetylglutamate synthase-like GNAT family acetyltransferase
MASDLSIVEYCDDLAAHFHDINAQWIKAMFVMEPHDRHVLEHPRELIIDSGGLILFVSSAELGIVGACALMKTGEDSFELTKMGVLESARGLKAGEFLLTHMIARARTIGAKTLYLLTNHICEAAIHLYEKHGFEHNVEIMTAYGSLYQRCDVAMAYNFNVR